MVTCERLTVPQLKQMCKIKSKTSPTYLKKAYSKYTGLQKNTLIPKCCGDSGEWVNPYYVRQLKGKINRQLNRPRGITTGGHQTYWDDDIGYNIVIKRPRYLGDRNK